MSDDFNSNVIKEFRENGGKVGGPFEGQPMLILTTIGAKSGEPRVNPLVYTMDGDRIIVIASKGGAPTNPAWYLNLLKNPVATLEIGTEKFQAKATVTEGAERDRLFDAQATLMPGFREYQKNTDRVIPVIAFERIDGSSAA